MPFSAVVEGRLSEIGAEGLGETSHELDRLVRRLPGVHTLHYVQVFGDRFQAHVDVTDDVDTAGMTEFSPGSTGQPEPLRVWDVRGALERDARADPEFDFTGDGR